jgi:ABC-2 type transport system permease protein
MTATTASPTRTPLRATPARTVRLGLARIRYEVTGYFRQGDSVFFTFLFPLLMLAIFSVAFDGQEFGRTADGDVVGAAWFYLPGMLAAGVLLSGLQNMSIDIALDRSNGTLKRLAGTPLPVTSYFIGKLGQVLVTGVLQATLLLVFAGVVFQVPLPTDPGAWLTFAWVFVLGVTTCALLGIGLSSVPRSGRSATAVIIPIVLVLQFISGVYIAFTGLPDWLQTVASVFPLKWLAQGMRAVFLPEEAAAAEATGDWDLGGIALATSIWLVVGLIACRATFRWNRRDA